MSIKGSTKIAVSIILFYCSAAIFLGLVDVTKYSSFVTAVGLFIPAMLFFGWCVTHASENNLGRSKFDPIFVALIPVLGIPVYFFRQFGIKSGLVKTLKFVTVVVCIYMPALTVSMWMVDP